MRGVVELEVEKKMAVFKNDLATYNIALRVRSIISLKNEARIYTLASKVPVQELIDFMVLEY